MINFKENTRVLCIGCHPDDIELGAAGLLYHLKQAHQAEINWTILTHGTFGRSSALHYQNTQRAAETLSAYKLLFDIPEEQAMRKLEWGIFNDCQLSGHTHNIIKFFENRIDEFKPQAILVHAPHDLHEDHRICCQALLSAARYYNGTIMFYQSPSTSPMEYQPNFFHQLNKEELEIKTEVLLKHSSQNSKHYMQKEYLSKLGAAWSTFLRMPGDTTLEAFQIYKSFLI